VCSRQSTAALSAGKCGAPGYQRSIFCAFVRLPLSASPGVAARDTCGSAATAVRPDGRPGTKPQAGERGARNAGPQHVPACSLAGVQPRAGRAPHLHKVHDQPHLLHFVRHRCAAAVRQGTLLASPAAHAWLGALCLLQQGSAAEYVRALRSLMPCGLRALRRLASWCTHPPAMCGTTSWTTMSTPASRPGATLGPTTVQYLLLVFCLQRVGVFATWALALSRP